MRRALVLLALLAPAPAQASVVRTSGSLVSVEDAGNEANAIRVAIVDDLLEVTDSAGAQPAGDCSAVSATVVRCPLPSSVQATLQGGPNLIVMDAALPLTAYGGPQADDFQGGAADDQLYGGPGVDRLSGGAGRDLLRGHDGDDLLLGGEGEDTLMGEAGFDDLDGGLGPDLIRGGFERDRLRYDQRSAGVRVGVPGAEDDVREVEWIIGSPFADVIAGSTGDDRIDAGEGDDRIAGGLGADRVDGESGGDLILGDAGDPEAPGEYPSDVGGPDELIGGPGMDVVRGDAGRDQIDTGPGDDVLDAREAEQSQEVSDEVVDCGEGVDRALLDWNDEPRDCEDAQVRVRPGSEVPPPVPFVPLRVGPGPQPALGRPSWAAGVVRVPVHCAAAVACSARVRLRAVRQVRTRRRVRSRAGRVLVTRRVTVAPGQNVIVELPLRSGRVVVELQLDGRRWLRPLPRRTLGS